jgi:hypothetical protein
MKKVFVAVGYDGSHHLDDWRDELGLVAKKRNKNWFDYYRNGVKTYEIRIIFSKAEFQQALATKGAIVIYNGHLYYGHGPIFAYKNANTPYSIPHDHPFRMGYDVITIPAKGYILNFNTHPKEFRPGSSSKKFPMPNSAYVLRKAKGNTKCQDKFARRSFRNCQFKVSQYRNGKNEQELKNRHYWYQYKRRIKGGQTFHEFYTLVEEGAADLLKSGLKCDVLFANGCKSQPYFLSTLRRVKRKNRSNCVFYLTMTYGNTITDSTWVFLENILKKNLNPSNRKHARTIAKRINASGFYKLAGKVRFYK